MKNRIKEFLEVHWNCLPWFVAGIVVLIEGNISRGVYFLCWLTLMMAIYMCMPLKGIRTMNRLTHERSNGIKTGYWSPNNKEELVQRLAEYENTGLEPAEIKARCQITPGSKLYFPYLEEDVICDDTVVDVGSKYLILTDGMLEEIKGFGTEFFLSLQEAQEMLDSLRTAQKQVDDQNPNQGG